MSLQCKYLGLYIGCKTNKGVLTGICEESIFILSETTGLQTFQAESVGEILFLYLRPFGNLNAEEVKILIEKGFNIGRPKGYSFSTEAFIFLLSLYVDIFGLIEMGYAKEMLL
ncbi:MAG: hypothetical protein ABI405_09505 [Parafilimonas sp.]